MQEALAGILSESLQREADRAKSFLFSADTADDDLQGARSLRVLARVKAGQGHLGLLVHVSQRLDLFGVRTAATLLVVTIVTTGEIVGATRVHRRPDAFLILDRGTGGAEDEAVDTGFAQHHVCDHFTLIQLSVPLDIKLEVEDRQYEKVFHSESINSDNSYSI